MSVDRDAELRVSLASNAGACSSLSWPSSSASVQAASVCEAPVSERRALDLAQMPEQTVEIDMERSRSEFGSLVRDAISSERLWQTTSKDRPDKKLLREAHLTFSGLPCYFSYFFH